MRNLKNSDHPGFEAMRPIAYIRSDYGEKFGIPRQSGLVPEALARVVFLPEYRREEALRGLGGFSHIWLIWEFSETMNEGWSPTVRPPRLGGNKRVGVFATRSPYRPNPIGLSSVRLLGIDTDHSDAPSLIVGGADLLDGTPIYDIKPYLPAFDCHPDAVGGFADAAPERVLRVAVPDGSLDAVPEEKRQALKGALSLDPRPSYQDDSERVYGFSFAGCEVRFRVDHGILTVISSERRDQASQ